MPEITRRKLLRDSTRAALGLGLTASLGACATKIARLTPTPTLGGAEAALADLGSRLTGSLLLPGDKGYAAASAPANGRYRDVRPLAVARCADEADVTTCITWCGEEGVELVGRGGGHSYAGFSTTQGLLVDLGMLSSVQVDRAKGRAVTGGAALNRNLFEALVDGPLFLPGGTCPTVGVGGLVLGGGIGFNARWAGLTADHLAASRIVTAAGDLLELDGSNNPDLFWACRGGAGGSFGLNTQFTFQLVEVPHDDIAYYEFEWRGADAAAAVLSAFDTLLNTAPPAFNAVAMAKALPLGSGGPREAVEVWSTGQYIGPVDELRDLVAALLAAAKPTVEILETKSFWDVQRLFAETESAPHSFADISRYAAEPVPERVVHELVELLVACPSRSETANGAISWLGWVGGVANKIGRTETAYVHRDVTSLLRPTARWPNVAPESVGRDLIAWTDAMNAVIAPHTPNESYQNFPNRNIVDWQQAYYAENFDRLVEVKSKYDKDNLFHNAQSIPPRAPAV